MSDGDDSEIEARTASLGIGYKKTGTTASSLQRFMAEWSDDTGSSSSGEHGAESRLAPKKTAKNKRPWDEAPPAANLPSQSKPTEARLSKGQSSKTQTGRGKKATKPHPAPVLEEASRDIPPLNFRMPSFGSRVPK